jgi:hypothetical protein
VQKNAEDMAKQLDTVHTWHPPFVPRRGDKYNSVVVQNNLVDLAKFFGKMPFYFQWAPRREDPNVAIIVQKNLDYLAKKI